MKVIKKKSTEETQPITIEFSGREAEVIYSYLVGVKFNSFEQSAIEGLNCKHYNVTANEIDGVTSLLTDSLAENVKSVL